MREIGEFSKKVKEKIKSVNGGTDFSSAALDLSLRALGHCGRFQQLLGFLDQTENDFHRAVRIRVNTFRELLHLAGLALDVAQRACGIPDLCHYVLVQICSVGASR